MTGGLNLSLGDVNHNFDYLTKVIDEAVNHHIPAAPAKPFCPWKPKISKDLKKNKSQTWSDYKTSRRIYGRHDPITVEKLSVFQQAKAKIKQSCFGQREQHEEQVAVISKDHPKRLHGYIRSKKKCRPTVGPLLIGDSLNDSPAQMADCLSDAFCSVFDDTYPPDIHSHQTSEASISSVAIDRLLVAQRLKKLDVDSCPGPDKMHAKILKSCASSLAEPLSLIFDKSLHSSTLPTSWKSATVSPIYKGKGARSDPLNYRPISLTSIPCKTMERIIAAALTKYFETNIISPFQFGFRSGRSTTEQLLLTYDDISSWLDNKEVVELIMFDFSKAFDRVNHRLLLKKLKKLGVSGPLLDWIRDFLVGRKMAVSVGGCSGSFRDVTSGVPQGSVLDPLLFLVFVNHLVSSLSCMYMIFADDLKIYLGRPTENCPGLQPNIDVLHQLATDWGLQFNASKCVNLRFQHGASPSYESRFFLDVSPIAGFKIQVFLRANAR